MAKRKSKKTVATSEPTTEVSKPSVSKVVEKTTRTLVLPHKTAEELQKLKAQLDQLESTISDILRQLAAK